MNLTCIKSISVAGTPRVVAVLADDPTEFPALAADAKSQGADILEFRADFFKDHQPKFILSNLREVKKVADLPILLTIRQFPEGGYFASSESERLDLFRRLIPEIDAIDVELYATEIRDQVVRLAHGAQKLAILSYHNFKHTPTYAKLNEVVDDAISYGGDMVKIAVMATKEQDVKLLSQFTADFTENILLTAISMGEAGTISRMVNPFLGSSLTYGFVGENASTPGQIRVRDLRRIIDSYPGQRVTDPKEAEELLHAGFSDSSEHECVPA